MPKIIIANWKMNPQTTSEAEELYHFSCDKCLASGKNTEVVVCPPFVYLDTLSKIESSVKLGAQDCHWEDQGAFTGEISVVMLKNLSAGYVIVGHSERRWIMNESDEIINKKIKAVLKHGLRPILAVGEKEKGNAREQAIKAQLEKGLKDLTSEDIEKIIFAYEPVWAIGTGDFETPENAIDAICLIKEFLSENWGTKKHPLMIYGGSVDSKNIKDFLERPEIDGALVGGASVKKEEFGKILEISSGL